MVSTPLLQTPLAQQGKMIRNIFSTEDVNAGQIVKEFFVYDLSANGISSSQTLLTSGGYRQNCWGFDSLQGLSLLSHQLMKFSHTFAGENVIQAKNMHHHLTFC